MLRRALKDNADRIKVMVLNGEEVLECEGTVFFFIYLFIVLAWVKVDGEGGMTLSSR